MSNCSLTRKSICASEKLVTKALQSTSSTDDVFGEWNSSTLPITGSAGAVTKGDNVTVDYMRWKQIGKTVHVQFHYSQSDNTGAAPGVGSYEITLPVTQRTPAAGSGVVGTVYVKSGSTTLWGVIQNNLLDNVVTMVVGNNDTTTGGLSTVTATKYALDTVGETTYAGSLTYEAA